MHTRIYFQVCGTAITNFICGGIKKSFLLILKIPRSSEMKNNDNDTVGINKHLSPQRKIDTIFFFSLSWRPLCFNIPNKKRPKRFTLNK